MSRSGLVVGLVAVLSVLTSVVTLTVASATGHGLHIAIVNVAVIAGAAAIMAVLLHERTPENNLWRVLLASAIMGPVAVVLLAAIEVQPSPPQLLLGGVWLLDVPLTLTWVLFFGLFPDGHRPVKWWYAAVAIAVTAHAVMAPYMT